MSHLHFVPALPVWCLLLSLLPTVPLLWRAGWPRRIAWLLLMLCLSNPRWIAADSTALPDIAVILVDDSQSTLLGDRPAQKEAALTQLRQNLAARPNLDVQVVHLPGESDRDDGTLLFGALDRAMATLPRQRLAAAFLITDGNIHDIPDHVGTDVPLHLLLVGHRHDRDRHLVVEQAPGYAMMGGTATLTLRIDDPGQSDPVTVTLRRDGGSSSDLQFPVNRPVTISVPIDHPGANLVELAAAVAPGELTAANNRAVVSISGVRDRLRVLLVSGEPRSGERTWRNLLKADPSVDLLHFTILRGIPHDDPTPNSELALIPFPVRTLFQEKLSGFDLVILDECRITVLPPHYFQFLADYVRHGGALLAAAGPEFATPQGLASTALQDLLPIRPDGRTMTDLFVPTITTDGQRHPVTANLAGPDPSSATPAWGRWARLIGGQAKDWATTVMAGPDGAPLLSLGRVGDGRVALLMSDSAWLWDRGWDGGGPQQELLRRLAHWLMKEPDLEEERLTARFVGDQLQVQRQSVRDPQTHIVATDPDGQDHAMTLGDPVAGLQTGMMTSQVMGLWRVSDGQHVALTALGSPNPIELSEVRASPTVVQPKIVESGGGIAWLEDGLPSLRDVGPDGMAAGGGWVGLRRHGAEDVHAIKDIALLPAWSILLILIGALGWTWWREGK